MQDGWDLPLTEPDIQEAIERCQLAIREKFCRRLLGGEQVRLVERIVGRTLSQEELVKVLVRRAGVALLAQRPIRHILLGRLSDEALHALLREINEKARIASTGDAIEELARKKWHRGSNRAKAFCRALQLPLPFAGSGSPSLPALEHVDSIPQYRPLHPYQKGLVRAIRETLQQEPRLMVSSFTGTGKTRIGMELVCLELAQAVDHQNVVFWVAQKSILLEQAIDALRQLWPHRGGDERLTVVRYYEGRSAPHIDEVGRGPIVVFLGSQQAAFRSEDPFLDDMLTRCRILFIDEAHSALAPGHQELIKRYRRQHLSRHQHPERIIGLSATPGRSDLVDPGESKRLALLFHGRLVVPDVGPKPYQWFQDQGYLSTLVHPSPRRLPSQVAQTLGKRKLSQPDEDDRDYTREVLEVIGRDKLRNTGVHTQIIELHRNDPNKKLLVFCCSIEQVNLFHTLLTLDDIPSGIVHSGIDTRDRRATLAAFRRNEIRILLNVEVLTLCAKMG